MRKFVGIVTCGSPTLAKCVASVRAQGDVDVAVWNNGDGPVTIPGVLLTCSSGNAGVAAAWNGLARQAWSRGYDRLVVLNDDVILGPDSLRALWDWAALWDCGGFGGPITVRGLGFCCFALPKSTWEAVGEFDEGFWPGYDEDADYAFRCALANRPERYVSPEDCPIQHDGGMSTKSDVILDDLVARAVPLLRARYRAKWGGPAGQETFSQPWNGGEPWPSTKQGLDGGPWPGSRLRVLFELSHTGVDREIIRGTGFDVDAIGGWGNYDRPKPQNMRLVSEPEGPYDVAVVESRRVADMLPPGLPFVLKCHNDVGGLLQQDLFERAAAWVTLCRETIVRWGVNHPKAHFIEHGIDTSVFKSYRGGAGVILSVGNAMPVRPEKGPHVLAEVAQHVNVSLLGDLNDDMEGVSLQPYCRTMDELADKYASCEAYLNPSDIVGSATLEAMATGCPIVTMTPTTFTDLLQHGRNCLIAHTVPHAIGSIQHVLQNRELALRLGAQARADVVERLQVARCGGRWGKLLLDVSGKSTYAGWHPH